MDTRIPLVLALLLAHATGVGATELFGVPTGASAQGGQPPSVAPPPVTEGAAVPRGFAGPEPFMEVVNAIESAAAREIQALNAARAAQGKHALPYDVRVSVVGSSVTGFSENPHKNRRAFGPHSDIDFMLESDTLVEAARRRGLDPSKNHVHPERLTELLPELQEVKATMKARAANPMSIGVSNSVAARTAGWSSENIVVDAEGPRRVKGIPEPVTGEGRENLTRAEARELQLRLREEVARLRREAASGLELAGEGTTAEAQRMRREARAQQAAARHIETNLIEPVGRALASGRPVPAAEARTRLARYELAKIDGVRVAVNTSWARDAMVQVPEPEPRSRTPPASRATSEGGRARAATLDWLREQATSRLGTREGAAARDAYLALREVPPETSMAELMRRPEVTRLPRSMQAEMARVVRSRAPSGRAGRGRPGSRSEGRPGRGRGRPGIPRIRR